MPYFAPNMPIPEINPDTAAFWAHCRDRELVVQCCSACGSWRFAPAPLCPECHSGEYRNVVSRGEGEIYSWTVTHRAVHPGMKGSIPFNIVAVRLDDCGGAIIISNLPHASGEDLRAGARVKVIWDVISETIVLPRFELA